MFWHVWFFFCCCFSVIYKFLLLKACSRNDLLSTRGPEKARRKADARAQRGKAPATGAKSSQQSVSVFCLVMNSQPSAWVWLFFWFRTALFGPDWSPPHLLPPWETREHRAAQRSPFPPPQNTVAKRKPDLQTATVFLQQTCDSF